MDNQRYKLTMCEDDGRVFNSVHELREYIESRSSDGPMMYKTTIEKALSEALSMEKILKDYYCARQAVTTILDHVGRKESFLGSVFILRNLSRKDMFYRVYDDTDEGELAMLEDAGAYVGVFFEKVEETEELNARIAKVTMDNLRELKACTTLPMNELVELGINLLCEKHLK